MKVHIQCQNLALSNKIILGRLIRAEAKIDQQASEILDLKARSMKDNFIIKTRGDKYKPVKNEDTAEKLREFLRDELKIPDTQNIKIMRAHRMGRGNEKYNPMMIAKLPYAQVHKKIFDYRCAKKH